MNVLLLFLIGLGVIASLLIVAGLLTRRQGLSGAHRRELRDSRATLERIRKIALQHQEIEPNLAALVLDEITAHYSKDLA